MTTSTDPISVPSMPPTPPQGPPASAPPPPPFRPPAAAGPPRGGSPAPQVAGEPSRPLRERIPEVIAAIGGILVAAAVAGFVSSSWDQVGPLLKAMILGVGATGLTSAALFADGRGRRSVSVLSPILWAAGTATVGGALILALGEFLPDAHRLAVALAGIGAAIHGAILWQRRPASSVAQIGVFASLVFAVGPFSTSIADRWGNLGFDSIMVALRPIAGVFDPTVQSDAFLVSGPAYAVLGAIWLALAHGLSGRARRTGEVGGSLLLAVAALQLNVLTNPVGAALALVIVLGVLVYGLATDNPLFVVLGSIGSLVAGIRVLVALFSGQVAATIAIFLAGLAMVSWAFRALQRRDRDEAAHVA